MLRSRTTPTAARRRLFAGAAIVLTALLAAGCGGSDDEGSDDDGGSSTETNATETETDTTETETDAGTEAAAGGTIEVGVEEGALRFSTDELTATAGTVTFSFENTETTPHDFVIMQDGERIDGTDLITEDTAELTVDLEAGEYQFICTPHESAGMVGTLTVS